MSDDLNNQAHFILINSQVLMDIWRDTIIILKKFQIENPEIDVSLNGINLEEVADTVQRMLETNVFGLGKVREIANLINSVNRYREHLEIQ